MSNLPHYHYSSSLSITFKKKTERVSQFSSFSIWNLGWLRVFQSGAFSHHSKNAHFHYWAQRNKSKLNLEVLNEKKKQCQLFLFVMFWLRDGSPLHVEVLKIFQETDWKHKFLRYEGTGKKGSSQPFITCWASCFRRTAYTQRHYLLFFPKK